MVRGESSSHPPLLLTHPVHRERRSTYNERRQRFSIIPGRKPGAFHMRETYDSGRRRDSTHRMNSLFFLFLFLVLLFFFLQPSCGLALSRFVNEKKRKETENRKVEEVRMKRRDERKCRGRLTNRSIVRSRLTFSFFFPPPYKSVFAPFCLFVPLLSI